MSAETITEAWGDFYARTPLDEPRTEAEYLELRTLADYLLDHVNVESGPYAPLFDLVLDYLDRWERLHEPELKAAEAPPKDVLEHLMAARGVTQYRLAKDGVAGQGTLSAILAGKRGISKALAKKLAVYFGVSVELFI